MNEPDLKKILAAKIKQARKRIGYTQEDLANVASLPHPQTVSDIEKGEREVKVWELANIAKALHVDIMDFMTTSDLPALSHVAWRVQPQKCKEDIEAGFLEKCTIYAELESLLGFYNQKPLPQYEVGPQQPDFAKVEQIAAEMNQILDLGSKPALSLTRVLEDNFGVKIWYYDIENGSAASARGEFGAAILMNFKEAPWRRNYNFAHELFHLITWDATRMGELKPELWSNLEKMADAFASYLLMPKHAIRDAFENRIQDEVIHYSDLVEVAREFEVSTAALLWRLYRLNKISQDKVQALLDDPAFQAVDKTTMYRNWRHPLPLPDRFVRLAFLAYQKGKLSRMQLSKYLDTSLIDLSNILSQYGFDEWENYELEITAS
ncbi:MAG: ImmA/IrrE family metallo-endopeptidase [Actinobacteria bacterium]|nr:ImmA/IrrE family metallo-endopeptidase [Actinomycetota bacterium]